MNWNGGFPFAVHDVLVVVLHYHLFRLELIFSAFFSYFS